MAFKSGAINIFLRRRTQQQFICRNMYSHIPYFCRGLVVRGFGRGSKQLGIPTANLDDNVISNLPDVLPTGVYYGWAQLENGPVYEMEVHILHTFEEDFYDNTLGVVLLGYIRDQTNFSSVDELIAAIQDDIRKSKDALSLPENTPYKNNKFFNEFRCSKPIAVNGISKNHSSSL